MSSVALQDAVKWTENLMDAEYRGRGDKEYLARFRLSQNTGVGERYLYRLLYQRKGMKDVAGEAYRLLGIAYRKYEELCNANEAAADLMKAERLELRMHHNEADPKPASQGEGMDSPDD